MANIKNNVAGIIAGDNCTIKVGRDIAISSSPQQNPLLGTDFSTLRPVDSFRGRDQELELLNKWLFTENKKMAVISGLPGYGKTELARHFAQHCKREKQVRSVLWLEADSSSVLEKSLRDLLRWLGDSDKADLNVQSVVQAVHQHFNTGSHLFVLDNAPDRRSVKEFLCDVTSLCLFTSHVQDWGDDVQSLSLAPLSLGASVDVFRAVLFQRFQDEDLELYRQLAELLSRVPLALQVAAALVRQEMLDLRQEFNLSNYVAEFQKSFDSYLDKNVPDFSDILYENTIYGALRKTLLKIEHRNDDVSKLSLSILHTLAYLNLNHIYLSNLQKIPFIKLSDKRIFKKALSLLQNFSFIRIIDNKNKILIHNLVQKILLFYQNLTEGKHNSYYISCLEYISFVYPSIHSNSILKVINSHIPSFEIFYKEHESHIINTNAFLYNLIKTGCLEILIKILENLGPYRAVDVINTHFLLYCAVLCQQHDVLKQLLARGADVEQRDEQRFHTALSVAAENLNLCALKILISHKADVNVLDREGDSILHGIVYASCYAQNADKIEDTLETMRWLVGHGARIDALGWDDKTLVHMAALVLSPEILFHLVTEFGLNVNAVDKDKQTPLFHLCQGSTSSADRERRLRTAECLLKLGARLSDVDRSGATPIKEARRLGLEYLAAYFENPTENIYSYIPQAFDFTNALRAAVDVGDIESLNQQLDELEERAVEVASESCLLHAAAEHKQHEALELLLERGVDINSRDDSDDTALNISAFYLDMQSMELLIQHGADVNAVGTSGKSVLHDVMRGVESPWSVGREDEICEMLRRLVKLGARTDAVMPNNQTILHQAAFTRKSNLMRCMITEFHMDVNAVDQYLQTALFFVINGLHYYQAEEEQGIRTAACLLESGARTDVLNARGESPAQLARSRGYERLAKFLDASARADVQQVDNSDAKSMEVLFYTKGEADEQEQTRSANVSTGVFRSWCHQFWINCFAQSHVRVNVEDSSSDEL